MTQSPTIDRAVVLAAGAGTRLTPHTALTPKPLVELDSIPLIEYTLSALADAGIRKATIVTGYRAGDVRATTADGSRLGLSIEYVHNPDFTRGASVSLASACASTEGASFLLVMSDHLLSRALIQSLLDDHGETPAVAADFLRKGTRTREFVEEATKIAIDSRGRVTTIGKNLETWDALDAGAFRCTPEIWQAVEAVEDGCELSEVFRWLAARGHLQTTDISGSFWYDVDTDEDLRAAGEILGRTPNGL